jgi:selenide,water dikinase
MTTSAEPTLTSLAHGGGCGCKISPGVLAELLKDQASGIVPHELLVGLETSDDAAVYQINPEQALIATTDFFMPIVDDPFHFGAIAATNAISDVYAMGGTPLFALALLGMPINVLSPKTIGEVLRGGRSVCESIGIPIAGGHSIDSVEPIYGLVVLGLAHPKDIKRNSSARAGDVLILGKPLGVGILSAALKQSKLTSGEYQTLIRLTTQLNRLGPQLAKLEGVHALTDVTGFGLGGHALEIARGSGLTATLDWPQVPIIPSARQYAEQGIKTGASTRNWAAYGDKVTLPSRFTDVDRTLLSDPQTSGGLLVSCDANQADAVLSLFKDQGFESAAVVGKLDAGPAQLEIQ